MTIFFYILMVLSFMAFNLGGSELNKHTRELRLSYGPLREKEEIQKKIKRDKIIMIIAFCVVFAIALYSTHAANLPCPK